MTPAADRVVELEQQLARAADVERRYVEQLQELRNSSRRYEELAVESARALGVAHATILELRAEQNVERARVIALEEEVRRERLRDELGAEEIGCIWCLKGTGIKRGDADVVEQVRAHILGCPAASRIRAYFAGEPMVAPQWSTGRPR